jgi:hypothetical protein
MPKKSIVMVDVGGVMVVVGSVVDFGYLIRFMRCLLVL